MGPSTWLVVVSSAVLAAAASSFPFVSATPTFLLSGAGADFPSPPGHVMATLADVKSSAFLNAYNANGLHDLGEHQPSGWCSFIAVREGILAFSENEQSFLFAPFGTNQRLQSHSRLVNPVFFGTLSGQGWTHQTYVGPMTSAKADTLIAVGAPLSLTCNFSSAHFAIYVQANFLLGGFGSGFPNAPTAHAELCTMADMRSETFVTAYNANGLTVVNSARELPYDSCCVVRVADNGGSYVAVGNSPLGPWLQNGTSECVNGVLPNVSPLVSPSWFGTGPWGEYSNQYLGDFNFTTESELSIMTDLPDNCSDAVAAWALFKVHPNVVPPPPAQGDCFEVTLQVSFYEPASGLGPCLADRWRYYMRINETYPSVAMSSLNECGGGTYNIYDLQIYPYNDTWLVATASGATGCNCTAASVGNKVLVPMNASARRDYSTICDVPQPQFGFCEVEFGIKAGPLKCP